MDPASFAFSTVSLLSVFQNCFQLYDKILAFKRRKTDQRLYGIAVEFERERSICLHQVLKSTGKGARSQWILKAVSEAERLLTEICALVNRHAIENQKGLSKLLKSGAWIISDERSLEKLLKDLRQLNQDMMFVLSPSEADGLHYHLRTTFVATANSERLMDIHEGTRTGYDDLRMAAKIKALSTDLTTGTTSDQTYAYGLASSRLPTTTTIKWAKPQPGDLCLRWETQVNLAEVLEAERAFGLLTQRMSPVAGDEDWVEAPIVVEWRSGFSSLKSSKEYRLDQLVYTIRQMHIAANSTESSPAAPVNFSMLYCEGWITTGSSFTCIGLVYEFPKDVVAAPISLRERIMSDRKRRRDPPALGLRSAMALALAQSLANMVTVGWMHKAFRSHNVLVFDKEKLSELFLAGFTYARPGDAGQADLSTLPCHDPTYQLYRPSLAAGEAPGSGHDDSALKASSSLLNTRFDTFGLGIVMLEVGLWKTVDSLAEPLADKMSARNF